MPNEKLNSWEILRVSSVLGMLIALPISGGTILGFYLDRYFHTGPILTLVFLFIGIILAFFGVFRGMKKISNG